MKIQIDTIAKTIKLDEAVKITELFEALVKLFPNEEWKEYKLITNEEWKEYKLITNVKIIWTEYPIIIEKYPVWPTYPTWPYITQPYTTGSITQSTFDVQI